jgi:hypothetical protein
MKTFARSRIGLAAALGMLVACASSKKEDVSQAPRSDDLLELLTGFGESLSKRNFSKAVDFMVPEEKALLVEGGSVPPEKQKMLLALPLQKLIRHPSIRVENGHIAGIYSLLPNLRQGEASNLASAEAGGLSDSAGPGSSAPQGPMASEMAAAPAGEDDESALAMGGSGSNPSDPQLKVAVNKFFAAVNHKNWSSALALMNEGERKLLLDDKGRLKESSKHRLAQIDQKNREALTLQDGKLTGVTLLLPTD